MHWGGRYRRTARACQRPRPWLVLLLVGLPGVAQAAGLWNLERGASTYGRGGANVAAPRDPIAVYINPAALAGQSGLQLLVDANYILDNRSFLRQPDDIEGLGNKRQYDEVQNDSPPSGSPYVPSPGFFFAYNLATAGLRELTVGGGVWGPPRSDTEFPADGAQRYSQIESHNLQIHYGLSAAYAFPVAGLKVGVTGMLVSQIVDTGLMLDAVPSESDGDDSFDTRVDVLVRDHLIPSAILGASATPSPWLTFAASYQLPWDAEAEGKADITLVGDFIKEQASVEGDEVTVNLSLPAVARFATQLHEPDGLFDVELALVWEGWSRARTIEFVPKDVVFSTNIGGDTVLEPLVFEYGFVDALSVRLGGHYLVLPQLLTVRAGAYYEVGAVPKNRLSPAAFDMNKYGGAAGARLELPAGLWLDLAAGVAIWPRVNIDGSDVRLEDPLTKQSAWAVGNGSYANRQIFVQAALGAQLDL